MCAVLNRCKCLFVLLLFFCLCCLSGLALLATMIIHQSIHYHLLCCLFFVLLFVCCRLVHRCIVALSLFVFVASLPCLLSGKVNSYQNQNDLNHTNKNIFILAQFLKYIYSLKLYNIVFLYVVYSALILQDDHAARTATHYSRIFF